MRHSGVWSGRRVLLAAFGAVFSAMKATGRQSRTKTELRVELELLGVKRTRSGQKVHSWSVSSLVNSPKGLVERERARENGVCVSEFMLQEKEQA